MTIGKDEIALLFAAHNLKSRTEFRVEYFPGNDFAFRVYCDPGEDVILIPDTLYVTSVEYCGNDLQLTVIVI